MKRAVRLSRLSLAGLLAGLVCVVDANALESEFITCPPISALTRNPKTHMWESSQYHGYWKSYSPSLLTELSQFTGAQYIGNTQGHVSCVYIGSGRSSAFPVVLHFGSLTLEPKNEQGLYKWQPLKDGWANCISINPPDCAFKPIRKTKQTKTQLYKELDSLKPAPDYSRPSTSF